MPRTRTAQLDYDRLADTLQSMSQRVGGALRDCRLVLRRADPIDATKIIAADEDIDALQQRVERDVLRIITSQQPMAHDLRWVLTTVIVAAELERMGDYAKQVALRVRWAAQAQHTLPELPQLIALGALAQESYDASLTAFHLENVEAARHTAMLDDQVDQAYTATYAAIRTVAANNSCFDANQASLAIAHAFERLSDRATNIAERTIFLATLAHEPLNS